MTPGPVPAVVELIERHRGPKYDERALIAPNLLRINGVPVWAPVDDPVVLHELHVDGKPGALFVAEVSLQVRRLVAGHDTPSAPVEVAAGASPVFSVVELVVPADAELLDDGQPVDPPYSVYANGHHLQLAEPGLIVERLTVGGHGPDDRVCRVRLPLVCRRFIVDDESDEAGSPPATFPAGA